ncbi:MAG TPA: peptide chain release factor N(5)-glutamine methyltransferase [Flavobacteriaceae bacterium]|nr:peptide chain release factor N(5)-glutamine methyltransferase [Flavobacteriaceae bacterium]
MKLIEFRQEFYNRLQAIYPKTEIAGMYGILLEDCMGISRVEAALRAHEIIPDSELDQLHRVLDRLSKQEPIQYILGKTSFYGLSLNVSPATLIPRPETEELVSWILSDLDAKTTKVKGVDIGTGSGCIALALKNNLANAEITAVDVSKEALEVVRQNVKELGLPMEVLQLDILKNSLPKEGLDFIVSNPPYVCETEKSEMRANVLDYEPDLALFVEDSNPLIFYDRILDVAKESVKEEGSVYFEINERFAEDIIKLAKEKGWKNNQVKKDIFGRDRMMRCRR